MFFAPLPGVEIASAVVPVEQGQLLLASVRPGQIYVMMTYTHAHLPLLGECLSGLSFRIR